MVIQRRLSPTMSVTSCSTSSGLHSDSGQDQLLPLYSEIAQHRIMSADEGDDSTTCSSRRPTFYSASSVVSEPCLPYYYENKSTFVFTARKRKNPLYILVGAFTLLGFWLYSQSHATLHHALQQVVRLTESRQLVHEQFHKVERDIRTLQKKLLELSSQDALPAVATSGAEEIQSLQDKLRLGSTQIVNLQRHLQEISKADALFKYGAGKIHVQLELEFPGSHHLKDGPTTFVMEMAPLDKMPHSVYMFLEMVDAHLLDGCSFILNAMHVIKAAPLPYDGSSAAAKVRSFAQKGLESVAFREYSPDFPHDPYTVGFAADDSPSFYINTQDNSDIHVGEPCFAKIVSGFDTIKRMEEAPTRNGIWYRQRIGIKRAFIL